MSREAMAQLPGKPLVKKYIDKHGTARRVGIPDRLKESQLLGNLFQSHVQKKCGSKDHIFHLDLGLPC